MVNLDDTSLENLGNALEEEVAEDTGELEETQEETEEATEPEVQRTKIGDQEYTSEELSELVGLGARAKDIGNSHGGFDKFVSEYGRKSERIGELNKKLEEVEKSKSSGESTEVVGDQMEEARQAARKLGIVLKDDLDGYYQNRRSAEKLIENCQTLEGNIDGTDGRPKFDTTKVLEFMNQNPGFTDPERAYKAMNLDEISNWSAEQISRKKSKGINTVTETSTNKVPEPVRANKDNLHSLISEQFS